MLSDIWLKGIIIGISIAAPVGPIGILCLKRTMEDGVRAGFVSGMGAATADAVYGLVACFGLLFVMDWLIQYESWIQLCGSIFLCYLGARIFITKPTPKKTNTPKENLFKSYVTTFFLTIANPLTIAAFIGIFSGLGIVGINSNDIAITLVFGVFCGSALWWAFLSIIGSFMGKRIHIKQFSVINTMAGLSLFIFGIIGLTN